MENSWKSSQVFIEPPLLHVPVQLTLCFESTTALPIESNSHVDIVLGLGAIRRRKGSFQQSHVSHSPDEFLMKRMSLDIWSPPNDAKSGDSQDIGEPDDSVAFTTTDPSLFEYFGTYTDETETTQYPTLTFSFLMGVSMDPKKICVSTSESEYQVLSTHLHMTLEARNVPFGPYSAVDNLGETLIPNSLVDQAENIQTMRSFERTSLTFVNPLALGISSAILIFRTNKPLYVGDKIFIHLPGFGSKVPIVNIRSRFCYRGTYLIPENVLVMDISEDLFFDKDSDVISLVIDNLILPVGLYRNDPGITIWTSDWGLRDVDIIENTDYITYSDSEEGFGSEGVYPSSTTSEIQRGRIVSVYDRDLYDVELPDSLLISDFPIAPLRIYDHLLEVFNFPAEQRIKTFMVSEISFIGGVDENNDPIVDTLLVPRSSPKMLQIRIRPNVDLYQGTMVYFHLPGFECEIAFTTSTSEALSIQHPVINYFRVAVFHEGSYERNDLRLRDDSLLENNLAFWNNTSHTLTVQVSNGRVFSNTVLTTIIIYNEATSLNGIDNMMQTTNSPDQFINEVITNDTCGLRLPGMISPNDGSIMISTSKLCYIKRESFKLVPGIGPRKEFTRSSLVFEPSTPGSISRLIFSFTSNCDIPPYARFEIRLGGLHRDNYDASSEKVVLSGSNAPLFADSLGWWNPRSNSLTLIVGSIQIQRQRTIDFFLETDQGFVLPTSLYKNDPSFEVEVVLAGIERHQIKSTSKVNDIPKQFSQSSIEYISGDIVPFPGSETSVKILFETNVDLPSGSIIKFHLPGFHFSEVSPKLEPPSDDIFDGTFRRFLPRTVNGTVEYYGEWDISAEIFSIEIAADQTINGKVQVQVNDVTLPRVSTQENDARFQIEVVNGQRIYPESIKLSTGLRVREFTHSRISYHPRESDQLVMLYIEFEASVDVTTSIVLKLQGFSNIYNEDPNLSLISPETSSTYSSDSINTLRRMQDLYIHVIPSHPEFLSSSKIPWKPTTSELVFIPEGKIPANTRVSFLIEETEGFVLPSYLLTNSSLLTIYAENSTNEDVIQVSPSVGDGVVPHQHFCAYTMENGVRNNVVRGISQCSDCDPWIRDPCSRTETVRCSCGEISDHPETMKVIGFNLMDSYSIFAVPLSPMDSSSTEKLCMSVNSTSMGPSNNNTPVVNTWSLDISNVEMGEVESLPLYPVLNFRITTPGRYVLCLSKENGPEEFGLLVATSSCPPPSLKLEGVCVDECPYGMIPYLGFCTLELDYIAGVYHDRNIIPHTVNDFSVKKSQLPTLHKPPVYDLVILATVEMIYPGAKEKELAILHSDDPVRIYFDYIFSRQMSVALKTEASRFTVKYLSEVIESSDQDSIVVSFLILPGHSGDTSASNIHRSAFSLFHHLSLMTRDVNSKLFFTDTLNNINPLYEIKGKIVRLCVDGVYRANCPLVYTAGAYSEELVVARNPIGTLPESIPLSIGGESVARLRSTISSHVTLMKSLPIQQKLALLREETVTRLSSERAFLFFAIGVICFTAIISLVYASCFYSLTPFAFSKSNDNKMLLENVNLKDIRYLTTEDRILYCTSWLNSEPTMKRVDYVNT